MPPRRTPATKYEAPVLGRRVKPFSQADQTKFERSVGLQVKVDHVRFAGILHEIGNLVARWRVERHSELEPTARQRLQVMGGIARSARDLANALAAVKQIETARVTEPEAPLPAVYPHDEKFIEAARKRPLAIETAGISDALAGDESDLPWVLEGLQETFEQVYLDQEAGKDAFNGADEAFAHILALVPVLARAAESHCSKLSEAAAASKPDADTSEMASASANEHLLRLMAPLYEEMFGSLGRSSRPAYPEADDEPARHMSVGPGIRFFEFIFGRLLGNEAPTANTIATWIQRRPREHGRASS